MARDISEFADRAAATAERPAEPARHPVVPLTGIRDRGGALRGIGGAGTWAVADQCLISGTNFFTGWILARYCAAAEYGSWALAFSVLLMLNALQTTLITGPMMVLGPQQKEEHSAGYAGALGAAQAVLTTVLAAAAGFGSLFLDGGARETALAMAGAVLVVQGHEFFRRVLYSRLMTLRLLLNDVVSCGIQIGGLVLLQRAGAGVLSSRNAFAMIAAGAAAGLVFGVLQARPFVRWERERAAEALRDTWNFGRWGLGTLAGDSLYHQGTLASVAAMTGTVGAAMIEAPRLLLAPLNILIFSGNNLFAPHVSKQLAERGQTAMPALLRKLWGLWMIPILGYPLVVAAAPEYWLGLLYGGKYDGAGDIVRLWAASQCIYGLRAMPWLFVNVMRRADLLMYASVVTGLAAVATAWMLLPIYGAAGAISGRLAADVAMLALAGLALAKLFGGDAARITER